MEVFYNGKGLNNDGDTTTTRVLGVGLKTSVTSWCTSDAKAYTSQLSSIECKATGSAGNYTFDTSAIKNGTNNLSKIATALYVLDDTGTKSKYPAFYWAQDYKDVTDSKVTGTDYENGW